MRSCSLNLKILICFAIFLAVAGLSCKKKDADKSSTSADSNADNIAVTIDGVDIPECEIDRIVKPQLERIAQKSAQLPPTFTEQYAKQLREEVLEQTIRRHLLVEKV